MALNIVQILTRRFRSVELRTTELQLTFDFGDFPPFPLSCESRKSSFEIVRTRWIGNFYDRYKFIASTIVDGGSLESSSDQLKSTPEFSQIRDSIRQASSAILEAANKLKIRADVVTHIVLTLALPVFMYQVIKLERGKKILGVFLPLSGTTSQIMVRMGRIDRAEKVDSVVTHEHLHFLQFIDGQIGSKSVHKVESLIEEKYVQNRSLLYLLERNEVEARLHELVISFYRLKRYLPLTVGGFIEMLASNNQIGWLVSGALKSSGISFDEEIEKYNGRDPDFTEQLEHTMVFIKDENLVYRFASEVLAVMYGNLLRYYGDRTASEAFLREISRPNLYDELYAVVD